MLRTFIDKNGSIQFIQPNTFNTNQMYNILNYPNYPNYSNLLVNKDDTDNDFVYSFQKPIIYTNNISNISNVNNDPELRKKVVRYFYDKYANTWLPFSFMKLQKYLISTENNIEFIKNINDYNKELSNNTISSEKIDFIIKNVFGKHELLVFLDKFINKNNFNWYDLKTIHFDKIKSELYDKIKNHMKKIVIKKL